MGKPMRSRPGELNTVFAFSLLVVGAFGGLFFGYLAYLAIRFASAFPVHVVRDRDGRDDAWLTFWAGTEQWKLALLYGTVAAISLIVAIGSLVSLANARRTERHKGQA